MVLDKKFSRRQALRIGAGGAIAVGLAPLGPAAVLAAPPEGQGGRLIPPAKVGTITFTQRDVPGRRRHRRQRGAGCAADHGLARRCQLPRRPHGSRSAGATAGRLERAVRVPRHGRLRADRVRRLRPERRESRRRSAPHRPRGRLQPRGRTGVPRLRAARFEGSSTTTDSRRSATMASSRTPGPDLPAPAARMSTADYDRFQTELEFASILGMPFMGTGNDPDQRQQPEHRAVDGRRGEVGGPQHAQPRRGESTSTRTTTPRPTTSSRTARWSRSPRTG